MIGYVLGIGGLVIVLLLSGMRAQEWRVDAAVARRDLAEKANVTLAESIGDVNKRCQQNIAKAKAEASRALARVKAAAAKAEKDSAAQKDVIEKLVQQANTAEAGADNCDHAKEVLNALAIDRNK